MRTVRLGLLFSFGQQLLHNLRLFLYQFCQISLRCVRRSGNQRVSAALGWPKIERGGYGNGITSNRPSHPVLPGKQQRVVSSLPSAVETLRASFEVMEVEGKGQEHTRPTGGSDTTYGGIFRACELLLIIDSSLSPSLHFCVVLSIWSIT